VPLAPLVPTSAPVVDRLTAALARAARGWRGDGVLRVEVPVAPTDPLLWVAAQPDGLTTYWRGRSEREARAGVGAALVLDAPSLAGAGPRADLLSRLPADARLFTTARFDADAEVGEEWTAFGAARFVLPRVELRSDGARAALAVHLAPGESPEVARKALAALRPALADVSGELPLPFMRRDDPARAEWDRMLRWSLSAFADGTLQKVVLARRARFLFEETVDPVALLRRLEPATPRCYHALVAPPSGPTFLTATPERLLRLDGRTLETEAVAGTRPRAEADAADDRLRDELLASEKDQREHAFVRDAIADALAALATRVDIDDTDRKPSYDGAGPLRASVSPRLADIVERINTESDNLYAEQVFRTLGRGTVDGGAQAVAALVAEAGADAEGLYIADGSGLSRKDMVTPTSLAAVLRMMRRHPTGPVFLRSLPQGGEGGSTLRNRLGGIDVQAKTGSLLAVRCLAGYVDGPGGTPYVFVLMANNYTTSGGRIARAQDEIVRALAAGRRVPAEEEG